uniref:Small neutral protease regulatory protein n=1 Tax=Lygus hesperus TaxID=30085 RepID=A0A0A9WL95_LYGHE
MVVDPHTNSAGSDGGQSNFLEVDYCTSVDEEEPGNESGTQTAGGETIATTVEQVDGGTILSEDDRELIQNYLASIGIHETDIHDIPEDQILKILSDKHIKYMSAREKHNVRKVRQIVRNVLMEAMKRRLMEESDIGEDEALQAAMQHIAHSSTSLHGADGTAAATVAGAETAVTKQPSSNDILHTIYTRLLRTVEGDDLTTAKMSQVIGNLEYFGLDDAYFILPKNKRSAPVPVKSPYYFYQCDYRRAFPHTKITKKSLETNWKQLDCEKKEYFVRLYELDKIRHKFQMLQYHRLQESK